MSVIQCHPHCRASYNPAKICACQGWDNEFGGASFSFGCSWSYYFNLCKFNQGESHRKFKLNTKNYSEEEEMGARLEEMATHLSPLYKRLAPQSHANQVDRSHQMILAQQILIYRF